MKIAISLFCFMLLSFTLFSQTTRKVEFSDSYYFLEVSKSAKPHKVVFLLPGFGERPEALLNNNFLLQRLLDDSFQVVIPWIQGQSSFYIDPISLSVLDTMLAFKVQDDSAKIILGGFSLSGSAALKYYQQYSKRRQYIKAIFAIDPPLDMVRICKSCERTIAKQSSANAIRECQYINSKVDQIFKNEVQINNCSSWKKISIYTPDTDFNDVSMYKDLPVYLVTKIDAIWLLNYRGRDFYDHNSTDIVSFVNDVKYMGGRNIRLQVVYPEKQSSAEDNPHNWNILDADDLIKWILSTE